MKKIWAILLTIIMIVTTCITMPVVSFADNEAPSIPSTSVTITPTIFEQEFTQNVSIETIENNKTASAWFSIKPSIAGTYNINNVDITGDEKISSAEIVVLNYQGQPVEPSNGKYSFAACTGTDRYYIRIKYLLNQSVTADKIDVKLKAYVDPVIITANTPAELELSEKTAVYYSFTPSIKGGYTFSLEDVTASSTDNVPFNAQVLLSNGVVLGSDFAQEGKIKSSALYLSSDTTYIIKVYTEGAGTIKLKLSVQSVFDGTTGANITVKNTLNISDTVRPFQLYCFQNKKISYWYKVSVTETGYYEFRFNNKNNADSDDVVSIILHEDEQLLDELIDDAAFAGEGENVFYVKLDKDTNYFLQLRPLSSSQLINFDITFRQHKDHSHYLTVDETGGVYYGCVCKDPDEEQYYYEIDDLETMIPDITYTGNNLKAVPVFKFMYYSSLDDKEPVVDQTCYTITYKNSAGKTVTAPKQVGKYTATINFCKSSTPGSNDSLAGLDSIKKTFKVIPKGSTLSNVTAAKAGFTAKWNKRTTQTTGYQLQYSTNKNFNSAKTVTISKNTAVSKRVSNLKSGKTYYVRVRTYKTVDKTKYYSTWSAANTVKTK